MKLSVGLPQTGALASVAALEATIEVAERHGVHGLWAVDRLLDPVAPRDPYPASADGRLPAQFARTLDPLQLLGAAAARSTRLRVGTNVLVMPWYNPVMLARSLAALDVLSGGRLDIGLGIGWSSDEVIASGPTAAATSARRADEFVDVLRACLGGGVVDHDGECFTVPASRFGLTPEAMPPIYFAAYSPGAMARIARCGDGWLPASLPFDVMTGMWSSIRQMAAAHGRDPESLRLVVRGNTSSTDRLPASDRPPFQGDLQQLADDVARCAELGADEVILDLQFTECSQSIEEYVDRFETLLELAGAHVSVPA